MADGAFHSGTRLAKTLGITRSAVWKQLHELESLGLEVCAVAGKGYRLVHPLELLDRGAVEGLLDAEVRPLIASLEIFRQIDSTNRYLCTRAEEGAAAGAVCLSEAQTAGRGRRGRTWVSPFGSNIYLSVLWRFQKGPAAISGLSLAAGVAAMRALKRLGVAGVGLKWPNDIYWGEKKLGGILVEVRGESFGPCSVVLGLGLNFHMLPRSAADIDQPWVDLSRIMGQALPSRNATAAALVSELMAVMAGYEESGLSPYLPEWRELDAFVGRPVTLFMGQDALRGVVRGVSDDGLLLLEREDGVTGTYASGEVGFSG